MQAFESLGYGGDKISHLRVRDKFVVCSSQYWGHGSQSAVKRNYPQVWGKG